MSEEQKPDKIFEMESKLKRLTEEESKIKTQLKEAKREKKIKERETARAHIDTNPNNLLEMQVSIKTVLIFIIGILIILGIFLLGRYTTSTTGIESSLQTSSTETNTTNTVSATDYICSDGSIVSDSTKCPEEGSAQEGGGASITDGATETAAEDTETVTETTTDAATTGSTDALEDNTTQAVVTSYKNIKLEFRGNGIDVLKTTTGKVIKVYYKITNNEGGIIKPKTISFVADDGATQVTKFNTFNLPASMQEMRKGAAADFVIDSKTDKNIANKLKDPLAMFSTSDTEVTYKLLLNDAKDKVMATVSKKFTVG